MATDKNKVFSLIKNLINKDLITEIDSPSDFSMPSSGSMTSGIDASTSDTGSSDTSTDVDTSNTTDTSTDSSSDELNSQDLFDTDNLGQGLSGGIHNDFNFDDNEEDGESQLSPAAPKYKVLDVIFDDDDDLNTKVKIQDVDTGKTEIKNLSDIII